jgi:phospholipase C
VDIFVSSQDQPTVKGESVTKFMLKAVVLFALFVAVVAQAQTLPTFRHIVVIFQENRTPDNLFGSTPSGGTTCGSEDPFEPGVDIRNGGSRRDAKRVGTMPHPHSSGRRFRPGPLL